MFPCLTVRRLNQQAGLCLLLESRSVHEKLSKLDLSNVLVGNIAGFSTPHELKSVGNHFVHKYKMHLKEINLLFTKELN